MKKIVIWGRVLVNLFRGYNDIGMEKKLIVKMVCYICFSGSYILFRLLGFF